ncbi:MAG TPA: hypothetical protein VGG25_19085 [Streptosporangiaceae bacterium]
MSTPARPPSAPAAPRVRRRGRHQAGPSWSRRPARHAARPRAALPDWDALGGAELQAAWHQLVAWVTWLHDRYELSVEERLPHCWAEHPGLIEELSALKAWHDEIYGADQPSGQAARYWHAELRQTVSAALTFYAAGCRAGHHGSEPAAVQLRERWASSGPASPGAHGHGPGYLPGPAMASHLAAGRAAALSDTITSYLHHDQSWWMPARDGWQRITDRSTTALLDHHARAMAQADAAVRQAAAIRQERGR